MKCDETWSFTNSKTKNVETTKGALEDAEGTWTWTAITDNKLLLSHLVGGRDAGYAHNFMTDVADRLNGKTRVIAGEYNLYANAVENTRCCKFDCDQLIKFYGKLPTGTNAGPSYAECIGTVKSPKVGNPEIDHISTSNVEHQNSAMRMHMRRFTRLTNAYTKKITTYRHMVALYTVYYNFVKTHKTLRITPAMKTGLANEAKDLEWIVALIDFNAPKPGPRGKHYKQ